MIEDSRTIAVIRRVLLATLIVGLLGTVAELFLLKHIDGLYQLIPVGLIGVALLCLIWFGITRGAPPLRALQWVMALFLASGIAGAAFHYTRNVADARESDPSLSGKALYMDALLGTTPALAPGAMIQLGLIGLLFTFRHPALGAGRSPSTSQIQ